MNVIIEAAQGSPIRVRLDEQTLRETGRRTLRADYPYAYGFIPGTQGPDGNCLDCFVLGQQALEPGQLVDCDPVDVFILSENEETDIKILAAASDQPVGGSLERCHAVISAFLVEVFKAWPEVSIGVGPLLGKAMADTYLKDFSTKRLPNGL